jgi:hypothetical protein
MNKPIPPDEPRSTNPAVAPMLEYGQPNRAMSSSWQFCLGVLLSAAPILFLAIIGPLVAGVRGLVIGMLLPVAVLAAVAVRMRRGIVYRPMAAGIWTGVALALLLDGLCWFALSGMRIGG